MNQKLLYLVEGAKRQGRVDWFHTCLGVLMGLSIDLAFNDDQRQTVFNLLKTAVTGAIKFLE